VNTVCQLSAGEGVVSQANSKNTLLATIHRMS
jgi:hypothetical protein